MNIKEKENFQTIESILKLYESGSPWRGYFKFPDYWVYFKAATIII